MSEKSKEKKSVEGKNSQKYEEKISGVVFSKNVQVALNWKPMAPEENDETDIDIEKLSKAVDHGKALLEAVLSLNRKYVLSTQEVKNKDEAEKFLTGRRCFKRVQEDIKNKLQILEDMVNYEKELKKTGAITGVISKHANAIQTCRAYQNALLSANEQLLGEAIACVNRC